HSCARALRLAVVLFGGQHAKVVFQRALDRRDDGQLFNGGGGLARRHAADEAARWNRERRGSRRLSGCRRSRRRRPQSLCRSRQTGESEGEQHEWEVSEWMMVHIAII